MRRILFVMLALVLAIGLTLPAAVTASGTKIIHVRSETLTEVQGKCNDTITSWHFIINQIADESLKPASITVYWDNGASAVVPLDDIPSQHVAHYTTTLNAGSRVTNATAVIYTAWGGKFNLSSIGCGGEPPAPPEAELTVIKFYDSNANGKWDLGEPSIAGWNITINGDADSTPFSGNVMPGTYNITESQGGAGWEATGVEVVGTNNYTIISPTEVVVNLDDADFVEVRFGNVKESLDVKKDAKTFYTRTHNWSIDKSVAPEEIWLPVNGNATATWTINVTYVDYEDSNHRVCGSVNITNNGTIPVTITKVEDFLGDDKIPVEVDFSVTFPYTIGVGATLTGTYCVSVDDKIPGHNLAIVYTERGGEYEAKSEELVWGDPTTEVNKSVTVVDYSDLFGEVTLGTVVAPNSASFNYTKLFRWADYGASGCGSYTYDNTAEVIGDDEVVLDSASATLKVNVQCYMYETAYARAANNNATCFIPTFSNWGWTNPITPGTYTWPLWAGAGQCDTSKGTLVGNVTVVYNATTGAVTVTYNLASPYTLNQTHVYAGRTMFPQVRVGRRWVSTVAPGQYYNAGPFNGTPKPLIYVIAHAKVGIPDPNFGP